MNGIHIDGLTTDVLKNLQFHIEQPGLYGIIGRNGIGKSTLFSLMSGETRLAEGVLQIGSVSHVSTLDIFDKYVTAHDYIHLLDSEEQKTFWVNMEFMGGASYLKKKISSYSLGMKELFAFVYSLSLKRNVYIFDELLDGLDEQRRFKAYRLLEREAKERIILLTSHNLSEVFKICDRVYLLEDSRINVVSSLSEAQEKLYQPFAE